MDLKVRSNPMTANDARANVQAWRNNQAQKALLQIEMDKKLNKLFTFFFTQIEKKSMEGLNTFKFIEKDVKQVYGRFDWTKIHELFIQLGFSCNRDWESYKSDWMWFIGW